jgi:hypothetical protein
VLDEFRRADLTISATKDSGISSESNINTVSTKANREPTQREQRAADDIARFTDKSRIQLVGKWLSDLEPDVRRAKIEEIVDRALEPIIKDLDAFHLKR